MACVGAGRDLQRGCGAVLFVFLYHLERVKSVLCHQRKDRGALRVEGRADLFRVYGGDAGCNGCDGIC